MEPPVVGQIVAAEVVGTVTGKKKHYCVICGISFVKRGNLNQHLRKTHQLQVSVQGGQNCGICDEKFRTMPQLHEHLQNTHSVPLNFVEETFYCEKDFQDWKRKIEKESLSSYVLRNSADKKDQGTSLAYYICHRSGHYKTKQNGIRNRKSVSIKTGSTCPAFMKVSIQTVDEISEIKVQYQSIHIGHDLETQTLRLSREERANLAACLKLGIPMDRILEQARQNISPTNRYCLLTRKHLHNIIRDYKIPVTFEKKTKKITVKKSRVANEKTQKTITVQNNDVDTSNSSIGYEDCLEVEESDHEEIEQDEKNTAVSSLLLLQNHYSSEEFHNRKMLIVNKLRELLNRTEKWDPAIPLPDVEEHIRAINAVYDMSSSSNQAFHIEGTLSVLSKLPVNNKTAKRKRLTNPKIGSKKTQRNKLLN